MKSDRYVITSTCQTPCGELILGSIDGKLCLCDWTKSRHRRTVDNRIQKMLVARYMQGSTPVIEEAKKQIAEYFDGRRREFDLPVNLTGTGFQQRVWEYISRIPYGTTRSYAALTSEVASESDIRAVSNAVGANSLSIIIPFRNLFEISNRLREDTYRIGKCRLPRVDGARPRRPRGPAQRRLNRNYHDFQTPTGPMAQA